MGFCLTMLASNMIDYSKKFNYEFLFNYVNYYFLLLLLINLSFTDFWIFILILNKDHFSLIWVRPVWN